MAQLEFYAENREKALQKAAEILECPVETIQLRILEEAVFLDSGEVEYPYKFLAQSSHAYAQGNELQLKDRDASLKLSVSPDGFEAFLLITPSLGKGKPLIRRHIEKLIEQNQIQYGLIPGAIEKALAVEEPTEIVIAHGDRPIKGHSGTVEYFFDNDRVIGSHRSDGSVDFRERNVIQNVIQGTVLAEKHPPKPGRKGMNIFGEEILPEEPQDVTLFPGTNTRLSEDGKQLIAEVDGHVTIADRQISVLPLYRIQENLDYHVGNIRFVGSVEVLGNVLPGFTIEAGGDIVLHGLAEKAELHAEKNLFSSSGILGDDKTKVVCGGSIEALFLQSCHVIAEGDIIVENGIIESHVESNGMVMLHGKKGVIRGGIVRATRGIEVTDVGTPSRVNTRLIIGSTMKIRRTLNEVETELHQLQTNLQKLVHFFEKKRISPKAVLQKQFSAHILEFQKRQLTDAALQFVQTVQRQQELQQRLKELQHQRVRIEAYRPILRIAGVVYPGTEIFLRNSRFLVEHVMEHVEFYEAQTEEGKVLKWTFL